MSEIERRKQRIKEAHEQAAKDQKAVTFIDLDGCEVTVRPDGQYFYNMADWY